MNEIYLLDKKNSKLLLVKDYLKEFYLNKGFFLLSKNYFLRFFQIFIYIKFFRKLKILMRLFKLLPAQTFLLVEPLMEKLVSTRAIKLAEASSMFVLKLLLKKINLERAL